MHGNTNFVKRAEWRYSPTSAVLIPDDVARSHDPPTVVESSLVHSVGRRLGVTARGSVTSKLPIGSAVVRTKGGLPHVNVRKC